MKARDINATPFGRRAPPDPVPPHLELGALLLTARRDVVRLSRDDLARELGGGTVSDVADRIERFERAEELPSEDEARRLAVLLELDPETVVRLVRSAEGAYALQRRPCEAQRWDTDLLAVHVDRLLAMRYRVAQRPEWSNICVHGARVWAAYLGGGYLTLGTLLDLWGSGELIVEVDSTRWYVFDVSGSPLSGAGGALTFRAGTGERRYVAGFSDTYRRVHDRGDLAPAPSPLSLGQLLADLGQPVGDIDVSDGTELVARYSHSARTLIDAGGAPVCTVGFAWPPQRNDPESSEAGWPFTSLPGPQTPRYRGWSLKDHGLVGRHRTLWYTGALPPAAVVALVDWVGDECEQ